MVLFIFTVGLQVGPSFFASFRKGGLQLNLLAVAIVALGVVGPIICCILIRSICKVRLEQEPVNLVEPVESAPLNTVGNQENAVGKSLMVVFVGMCLGVVLGSIAIPVGLSVPMKLGLAGGPLIVAILIGHFGTKNGLAFLLPYRIMLFFNHYLIILRSQSSICF